MKNIEKYQSLLETGEVDALLLTSVYNRLYAAQYRVAEGVAVVTREGAYYFTDSRYIEAAEKNLKGFTVRMTHPGSSEIERINEVIGEHTIKKLGFEENDAGSRPSPPQSVSTSSVPPPCANGPLATRSQISAPVDSRLITTPSAS